MAQRLKSSTPFMSAALVTGASKGIGEAMARLLAEAGARVVVSSRNQESCEAVAIGYRERGLEAAAIAQNTGHIAELPCLVTKVLDTFGGLDILINNAATNPVYGPMLKLEESAFDHVMNVNVKAPLELAKLAHPIMKKAGGGSVINIASVAGLKAARNIGIYGVSKAALIHMTRQLASEWGPDGVRVNAVCPGLIKTKFSQALWVDEATEAKFASHMPLRRLGEPDDLMGIALMLASDAGAYVTGGVFTVDGGETL